MYKYNPLPELIKTTEEAAKVVIDRHGVSVYVDTNPDDISPDIYIDPLDTEGIKIFLEFAAKMAAHYKSLNNKP